MESDFDKIFNSHLKQKVKNKTDTIKPHLCLNCKDIFYTYKNDNNRKYCSHCCVVPWDKGLKGVQTSWAKGLTKETDKRIAAMGRKISITKTLPKIKIVCIHCKKEFYDHFRINRNRKYCSRKCAAICNKNIVKTWNIMNPTRKKYLRKFIGMCSLLAQRNKSTYVFANTKFDSQEELAFAKALFDNNIITQFIENKNCHIRVDVYEFDFLINNIFIEYHPWSKELTHKQYYAFRRKILNENGFKNNKLIVIESKNKVGDFIDRLKQII